MVNSKEIKEKKSGFNIIDLIIILFVVLAAVGIFLKFNLAEQIVADAAMDKFEIEFVTENDIQEASQQYFGVGVPFYINIESLKIGEISEILEITNPALFYAEDVDGNIVKSELPGRIDVRGIMSATGKINKDGEYMINGTVFVAPNTQFYVHTGEIEVYIKVVSVKKADGQ